MMLKETDLFSALYILKLYNLQLCLVLWYAECHVPKQYLHNSMQYLLYRAAEEYFLGTDLCALCAILVL